MFSLGFFLISTFHLLAWSIYLCWLLRCSQIKVLNSFSNCENDIPKLSWRRAVLCSLNACWFWHTSFRFLSHLIAVCYRFFHFSKYFYKSRKRLWFICSSFDSTMSLEFIYAQNWQQFFNFCLFCCLMSASPIHKEFSVCRMGLQACPLYIFKTLSLSF